MITRNCSLCGVLIDPNFETCETCFAMLNDGEPQKLSPIEFAPQTRSPYQTTIERTPSHTLQSSHQIIEQEPPVMPTQRLSPPGRTFEPADDAEFERFPTPPLAMTTAGNDAPPQYSAAHIEEMQAAVKSFIPPGFATLGATQQPLDPPIVPRVPRYVPPPPRPPSNTVTSEYKPSLWNWIKDLPALAKVAVFVIIFSICFAVALKGFLTLDVSISPSLGATEPQTPWFSSWFRAAPTADEILQKHETETQAKSGSAVFQSFLVSGTAQILFTPPDGTLDIVAVRKQLLGIDQKSAGPTAAPAKADATRTSDFPRPWDMDITFEMALKNPNKLLIKMAQKPKPNFPQNYRAVQTLGFDGDRGWNVLRSQAGGGETTTETTFEPKSMIFNRVNGGISLAFVKHASQKTELIGVDAVYNRRVYNVKVTDENGTSNIFFDIETGLISKIVRNEEELFILAYDTFNGVKFPSKIIFRFGRSWLYMHFAEIKTDPTFDDTIFLRSSNR